MLFGKYQLLFQIIKTLIDSARIFHDPLHTIDFGTDASFLPADSKNGDQSER